MGVCYMPGIIDGHFIPHRGLCSAKRILYDKRIRETIYEGSKMNLETMQRYWSEDASNYGQIIEDELASFRVEAWKKFLSRQLPHHTQDVLDFGCGPGWTVS